jgi:mannonate dehydratase
MKATFRWLGRDDPGTLGYIRQIPRMYGIVSAIYDVPVGDVWSLKETVKLRDTVHAAAAARDVIESVPVHEDLALAKPSRDVLIANHGATLSNLGAVGIKVVCYNFMPVFDWTRATLEKLLPTVRQLLHLTSRRSRTSILTMASSTRLGYEL